MRIKNALILSKYKYFAVIILSMGISSIQTDKAQALTGEEILTKLDTDGQYDYVSGVLQGLSYARFLKDRPDQTGAKCIATWLIRGRNRNWEIAEKWLKHHKEKPAGVIIYTMVSKECGK